LCLPFNSNLIYLRQEHKGVSAASNLGIKHARGKIIALTEDDCVVPEDWIEKIAYFHKIYPEIAAIQGKILNYYQNNLFALLEQIVNDAYLDYILYKKNGKRYITLFYTGNCSLKKDVFQKRGICFNERLLACEDVDLSNQLTDHRIRILYAEEIAVKHKYRSGIRAFIKKHFRDSRWRYLLESAWSKSERNYNTKKFSPTKFFIKMSVDSLRNYKIKGLALIVLHIARKTLRDAG